jgi:hypothetical protein
MSFDLSCLEDFIRVIGNFYLDKKIKLGFRKHFCLILYFIFFNLLNSFYDKVRNEFDVVFMMFIRVFLLILVKNRF